MSLKAIVQTLLLLFISFAADAAEPVSFTAPTIVYDTSDPRFCINCRSYKLVEVTDVSRLKSLDGVGSTESFADYLADGSKEEQTLSKVLSGGYLQLSYLPKQKTVVAIITYDATRALTDEELAILAEYTRGQLLDGIGEGFTQSGARKQQLWVEFDVLDPKNIVSVQKSM